MKTMRVLGMVMLAVLMLTGAVWAQTPPRLVPFSGVVRDAQGQPRTGPATLTFAIYADAEGGTALWSETQRVRLDEGGRYSVTLGATTAEGLPLDLFTTVTGRWLGVQVGRGPELPRVMLVSVPYALKAADAETIGGKPLSAFVLAGDKTGTGADGLTYVNTALLNRSLSGVGAGGASSGTPGYLGMFTNTTDLGNSVLFQNGTRVGVGTTTPGAAFHSMATEAPGAFFDVYSNTLGALPVVYRAARGTPGAPTAVQTNDILGGLAVRGYTGTTFSGGRGQVMFKAAENWTDAANGTYLAFATMPTGGIVTPTPERMRIDPAGRVGIGTTTPGALLHVAGDAIVDGNLAAKYQDVAEWVPSGEALEAGTVVVVDPEAANGVRPSGRAYDVGVAGAVSKQPGLILGERGEHKSLVAQSGRVKVKVDGQYGAIKPGDLLVTSPTPGHAMVSQAVMVQGLALHRPGTILGKALEGWSGGRGEILVLLTLQ